MEYLKRWIFSGGDGVVCLVGWVCVKLFYNGYFFLQNQLIIAAMCFICYILLSTGSGIHLYFIINNYKVHLYNRTQGFTHCKFCWSYQQVSPRGGSRNQSSKTNVTLKTLDKSKVFPDGKFEPIPSKSDDLDGSLWPGSWSPNIAG